jgi:hypothetical protein
MVAIWAQAENKTAANAKRRTLTIVIRFMKV